MEFTTLADKLYITAEALFKDSLELAVQILQSNFRPNFMIGIWRGGTPVGIAVQELLDFCDVPTDHISIRTSSYSGLGKRKSGVQVHGLAYLIRNINAEDRLLIVDDVYDTGLSIEATIRSLTERTRRNTPTDIRVATPWFKPANNQTDREPDFYVHKTDRWLVFPHEIDGLDDDEIARNKPEVAAVLKRLGRLHADT